MTTQLIGPPYCARSRRPAADALVRLRVSVHRRVRVPLWRIYPPITESNCVVVTQGGDRYPKPEEENES